MSLTKFTMIFDYVAGSDADPLLPRRNGSGRDGGWSESWYTDAAVGSTVLAANARSLCQARAALLPQAVAIIGQRYQTVDPVGQSQAGRNFFGGSYKAQQDVPQMALVIPVRTTGKANRLNAEIRGIPDSLVERGIYVPTNASTAAIGQLFKILLNFKFRGQVLDAVNFPVATIDVDGNYVLAQIGTFVAGQRVKVLRTTNASGRQVSQVCYIAPGALALSGKLLNWQRGATAGGTMRLYGISYFIPDNPDVDNAAANVRKVGRPLSVYRGRASKRRS